MSALTLRPWEAADLPLLSHWMGHAATLPQGPGTAGWVAEGADGQPRACLRLAPAIGLALPRVCYHVGCTVHAAAELGLYHRQRTLLLGHDLTGASELADIGWAPELPAEDQALALRALVYAATHQLARERTLHGTRLVAELPGLRDAQGRAPFWEGLGRRFFTGDPAAALAEHGPAWRTHVASLLPRQPLLASFLPADAEAAIGLVHPRAAVLEQVLRESGLRSAQHINVEDGGPVLEAEIDDLLAQRSMRA